jgi:UDPglucose 6-dehydrogenase
MAELSVIGAGYVGLTTAIGMASLGHSVVCADILPKRVQALNTGELPIIERGMEEMLETQLAEGRLEFVLGATNAVERADIHFLCLPTPQGGDGAADLSFVLSAAADIADALRPGAIVVNKSTVPVGTANVVSQTIGRPDVQVVSNPEFLREGSALADFLEPDRVVVGSADPEAARRVGALYSSLDTVVMETDARSAELIKYASNAYLATKLTFVNEMAEICEQLDADIDAVMLGMGHDRRIGTSYLSPGPGWGGSCFPKDTEALLHIASSVDLEFDFLRNVIDLNGRHMRRVADKVRALAGGSLEDTIVGAWGLTFKAGTDDLRDSPALAVLEVLTSEGAKINAYDPAVSAPPDRLPGIGIAATALDAARGAQVLVVLTEWPEFIDVELTALRDVMASPRIVDARNLLSHDQLNALGFQVQGIGR